MVVEDTYSFKSFTLISVLRDVYTVVGLKEK